ncbi:MAG: hypothetical protein AAGF12_08340 [Myxococcota bacterium]
MNTKPFLFLAAAGSCAVGLFACNVFDEALYLAAEDGGSGDADASMFEVVLADRCSPDAPMLLSQQDELVVSTLNLTNRVSEVQACTGTTAIGAEGFFGIEMQQGEKWHFHVTALETDGDPVLYILDAACDERACGDGEAIDSCGEQDEHLSYIAPSTGTFFIGVDDAGDRSGTYELLPIRATCGDLNREHSETCDDGNTESGDGCSSACRAEIASGGVEMEPNDDPADANILLMGEGTSTVDLNIASTCDGDSFSVVVPAGGSVTAQLTLRGGTACTAGVHGFEADFVAPNTQRVLGTVTPAVGSCPEFAGEAFTTGLDAGEYYIRIRPTSLERLTEYSLTVTVAGP